MASSEASSVIAESTLVNGNLHGDEDLTVRGRVEGTLTLTKTLFVEQTGAVKAEVQVKSAVISGAVLGNVTASDSVELTKEGRMVGDISAPRVIIADGASFRGRISGEVEVGEAAEAERALPRSGRPALRAAAPRPAKAERDEEEGGEARSGAEKAVAAAAAVKPPPPPVPVAMGSVKRKVIVRRK